METIIKSLIDGLMTNPQIVNIVIGIVVSVLVSKLKDFFPKLDKAAKDPKQVKWVQLLVGGLTLLATLGNAWITGTLSHVDFKLVSDYLTMLFSALAAHDLGSSAKKALKP